MLDLFYLQLQHTLSTNHIPSPNLPNTPPYTRSPNRNSQSLERTLSTVVVILAVRTANMQSDTRRLGETLQAMGNHLGAQVADLLTPKTEINHRPRPAGEIDDCP